MTTARELATPALAFSALLLANKQDRTLEERATLARIRRELRRRKLANAR